MGAKAGGMKRGGGYCEAIANQRSNILRTTDIQLAAIVEISIELNTITFTNIICLQRKGNTKIANMYTANLSNIKTSSEELLDAILSSGTTYIDFKAKVIKVGDKLMLKDICLGRIRDETL